MPAEKLTPMMRQYTQMKEKYADCLLFFRLGDFYELFDKDAIEASRLLNLTLTRRQEVRMCGVPYHAVDNYLGRLTKLGRKVAICEQLSDPSLPGIVKRDVIRVVTPGTTFDERILDQKENRFIMSIVTEKEAIGLAACDLTTGVFHVFSCKNWQEARDEIQRIRPAECIVDATPQSLPQFLKEFQKLPVFPHQCWDSPKELLKKQFKVKDLTGFGIENSPAVISAAGLLVNYLRETQKSDLAHLKAPKLITRQDEMILDETAIRNLELLETLREGKHEGSLLSVIDKTHTPMGGRTLRQWLLHPLHRKEAIERRLEAVSEIIGNFELKTKLKETFAGVLDLERLLSRISIGVGNARDLLGIGISLKNMSALGEVLCKGKSVFLKNLNKELSTLDSLNALREKLLSALTEAPPLSIKDGGIIKDDVHAPLDELRKISREGKHFIHELQKREIEATGITSLKVRYNQVFGYYIEITKANLGLVPAHYTRKQTLVNGERFITPELKEYEEKILGAEEKIKALEYEIFLSLREEVKKKTTEIQTLAQIFGTIDTMLAFALVAEINHYTVPKIGDPETSLIIKNGRHPVIEQLSGGRFVPNDIALGQAVKGHPAESGKIILLTGPNMGGKSTYLRQAALIVLLAHIGSFVPADEAKIPLTDRIFTRVGATDNLVQGQSTFMVEMQETAQILHYATAESLIILDEIGRGTSTYDGVSLAWAILEYIHDHIGAKTLFATHYHELIRVAEKLPSAENWSVAVKEEKGDVIFLYRVLPGAIDRSYGIEVARLAGLPSAVITKAKTILRDLEEGVLDSAIEAKAKAMQKDERQLNIFAQRPHRVIEEIQKLDVNNITPLEALQKLHELKKINT